MLHLLLATALLVAPLAQDPAPAEDPNPAPDPAEVEEAVAGLEEAFKKGKTADRLAALSQFGKVNDGEVIKLISRGLRDKETAVRSASIEALRWLEHPEALDALHQSFRKDKAIRKDPKLYEAMVKAIGQHGSPKSIDALVDGALAQAPRQVQVARIYSLGNIRDVESIEALMDLMQRTGRRAGLRGGGGQPLMGEFRNALNVLTGEDFGPDEKTWTDWWKKNKRDFEVSAEATGVTKKRMIQWNRYWGLDQQDKDKKKKKKRGEGDGEGKGGGDEG